MYLDIWFCTWCRWKWAAGGLSYRSLVAAIIVKFVHLLPFNMQIRFGPLFVPLLYGWISVVHFAIFTSPLQNGHCSGVIKWKIISYLNVLTKPEKNALWPFKLFRWWMRDISLPIKMREIGFCVANLIHCFTTKFPNYKYLRRTKTKWIIIKIRKRYRFYERD